MSNVEARQLAARCVRLEGEIAALRDRVNAAEEATAVARRSALEAWDFVRVLRHVPRRSDSEAAR